MNWLVLVRTRGGSRSFEPGLTLGRESGYLKAHNQVDAVWIIGSFPAPAQLSTQPRHPEQALQPALRSET